MLQRKRCISVVLFERLMLITSHRSYRQAASKTIKQAVKKRRSVNYVMENIICDNPMHEMFVVVKVVVSPPGDKEV